MNKNTPINFIVIHHSGGTKDNPLADTSNHTFATVNSWHRQDPNVWLGYYSSLGCAIGYHLFIEKDGTTTRGRVDTDEGAHCRGYNRQSIGICLAGNFDVTLPTKEQEDALRNLLIELKAKYPKAAVVPHRHLSDKSCFGRKLSDTWASDLVMKVEPAICQPEKDEIQELKKTLSWHDSLINKLFKKI